VRRGRPLAPRRPGAGPARVLARDASCVDAGRSAPRPPRSAIPARASALQNARVRRRLVDRRLRSAWRTEHRPTMPSAPYPRANAPLRGVFFRRFVPRSAPQNARGARNFVFVTMRMRARAHVVVRSTTDVRATA
jgi:hypothetical protein